MKSRFLLTILVAVLMPFTSLSTASAVRLPTNNPHRKVCTQQRADAADCGVHVVLDSNGAKPLASVAYTNGYAPADLDNAYKLPVPATGTFTPNGQTVAIVDAYDNPNVANDILAYRQQFNLPLCTTTNPTPTTADLTSCFFTKVNQTGQAAPLPAGNTGWGQEIDLDVDMVSAACPSCKILLVEANSSNFTDLGAGVNAAAALHVNAISNSYGGKEFSSETTSTYANFYNHPGIAITASTGDSGYGVQFPAASPYVTAVGGTSLKLATTTTRGWTETAWSGTGSGCSSYVGRLSWQTQIGNCNKRMVADVSAVADPNTGVAVYDSYGSTGGANWLVFGGTSAASPLVASVYALAGNAGGSTPAIKYGEYTYAHRTNLNDVTSGSNGTCTSWYSTSNLKLCTAASGYDGPTGLGSPNGTAAF